MAFSGRVDMTCTCLRTAVSISSTTGMLDADAQKEGPIPWPFGSDARPLLWLGSRLAILAVVLLLFARVDLVELDEPQEADTQSDGDRIPLNLAGRLGAFRRLLREEAPPRAMQRRWLCPPEGKVCSSGNTWRVSACGRARETESPRCRVQHEGGHVGSGGGAMANRDALGQAARRFCSRRLADPPVAAMRPTETGGIADIGWGGGRLKARKMLVPAADVEGGGTMSPRTRCYELD